MAFKFEPVAAIYNPPEGSVVYEFDLHLGKRMNPEIVHLMQYDVTTPIIKANLYANNQPYKIPTGAAVNIRMNKPDGKGVYNSALGISSDRTSAYIAVTGQMTAAYGMGVASIEIASHAGLIGTAIMAVDVEKNPVQDGQYESTDEFKTLLELVEEAKKAAEEAKKAAEEATHPDPAQKGYYETAEALRAAYPSGEDGNWAIVGETDTIWVWDSDRSQWTDSGNNTDLSDYYTREETNLQLYKRLSVYGGFIDGTLQVLELLYAQGSLQVSGGATIDDLTIENGVTSRGLEIGPIYDEEIHIGNVCCPGYISGAGKRMSFSLQFARPIAAIKATFSELVVVVRGVQGYVDELYSGAGVVGTEMVGPNYTINVRPITVAEQDEGCIFVSISKKDEEAFTNVVNNTPISFEIFSARITFSYE